jgi:hypothetical protein
MRAVLLHRSEAAVPRAEELRARGVPIIKRLTELVDLVIG